MTGPLADWAAPGAGRNRPIAGARRIDNASQETGDFELMFRRIEYTPCFYLFGLPRRAKHRQRRQRSNKQHFVGSFTLLWLTLFPQEFPGVCHLRVAR